MTERDTYTDHRYPSPVKFDRLLSPAGLPPIYIAPSDPTENPHGLLCEVGSGEDFTRCTRAELLEWAESIVHALQTS